MEWLSLTGILTRERAVEQLLAPSTSTDANSELGLHAEGVSRIDAVAAAAIRLRIGRHHREHGQGTVTLMVPSDSSVAVQLAALLGPLPEHVTLAGQVNGEPPANYALVPATPVEDSHAAVALGSWTLDACERAGMARKRTAFVTEATMELADNAVVHAKGTTDAPVVAVTTATRGRVVEIAVLDTGRGVSGSSDPREFLRTIPRRALDGEPGFLGNILQRARRAPCAGSLLGRAGCSGRRCGIAQGSVCTCLARQSSCASRRSVKSAVRPARVGAGSEIDMVQSCQ